MNLTVNGTKDRKMALELNFSIWINLVTIPWVCLGLPLFVLGVQNINECPVDTDIPALLIGEKKGLFVETNFFQKTLLQLWLQAWLLFGMPPWQRSRKRQIS
jgi:hypothetical protein